MGNCCCPESDNQQARSSSKNSFQGEGHRLGSADEATRLATAPGSNMMARQDEDALPNLDVGRDRLAGEGDEEEVRVVVVDDLLAREGDDEEVESLPLRDMGRARLAGEGNDNEETLQHRIGEIARLAREFNEGEIDAQIHAHMLRGDPRPGSLVTFERMRRRRHFLRDLARRDDEALEHFLVMEGSRIWLRERLLDDIFWEIEEDFWGRREDQLREVELPPPPLLPHIQEYEDFSRSAGMTFSKAADGVELATASPNFDPKGLFIKRVTACIGWAVHGLIFEFVNGKRMGAILFDFGDRSMNLSDESIEARAGVGWTDVDYGDYIVGMHGDRLADPEKMWFCHTLVLEFASGKAIRYEAKHEPWRGGSFSYTIPLPCLVYRIAFKYEQNEDMLGLKTSIHLPIEQGSMPYLPLKYKNCVNEILMMGRKIDFDRESSGEKPLGDDVWWRILGMLNGWQLLPPSHTCEEASAEDSPEEGYSEEGGGG